MPIGERSVLNIKRVQVDGGKRGSIPEVSFDFCYTSKGFRNKASQSSMLGIVATDSQAGFIHVVPLGSKGQFRLIVQELMNFT